jgi:hypothetical protein
LYGLVVASLHIFFSQHMYDCCWTCCCYAAGAAGMFLRVFCQMAAALQEQGAAAMAPGAIWSQAAGQFNGEQLAYIAALASGSQLLFGDRPKDITYK